MTVGKNKLKSSKDLLTHRIRYKVSAFKERNRMGPIQVTDYTFAEFVNYGRIDTVMDTVYLDASNLSHISTPDGSSTISALNFVIAAFEDVKKDFKKAITTGNIPADHQIFSKMSPVMGYVDPLDTYKNHLDSVIDEYVSKYIFGNKKAVEILTFEDFLKHFMVFLKNTTEPTPITFTSWQRSNKSSIFTSGLALSLSSKAHDVDADKMTFIKDPIFQYYKNVCLNRGFSISHNVPWVIVADIDSPQMKKYYAKYFFGEPRSIFNNFYNKTYIQDLSLLKINILRNYNAFIELYPYERKNTICKKNRSRSEIMNRKNTNLLEIDKKFKNSYWLDMYANLRNMEENNIFHSATLKEKIKVSKIIQNKFDMSQAIGYINNEFRKTFPIKSGGMLQQRNRAYNGY